MRFREWQYEGVLRDLVGTRLTNPRVDEVIFDGLEDLKSFRPSRSNVKRGHWKDSWYGVDSASVLERYVEHGWPGIVDELRSKIDRMDLPEVASSRNVRRRRKRVRGDHGAELDIHAVNQGRSDKAWDRMIHVPKLSQSSKLVHVVCNATCPGGVDADDQLWRGAVAFRLVESLTAMGKSVAVTVMFNSSDLWCGRRNTLSFISVKAKEYGDPLDEDKLATMFTAGFWRMYLMERGVYAWPDRNPVPGCGRVVDSYEALPIEIMEERAGGAHVVALGQAFTKDAAERLHEKAVRQVARLDGYENLRGEGLDEYLKYAAK